MPGLSKFKFEGYEWPESLTVGGLAFSIAESLYTMRNSKNHKKTVLWNDEEIINEMKNFYSTTDWTKAPPKARAKKTGRARERAQGTAPRR